MNLKRFLPLLTKVKKMLIVKDFAAICSICFSIFSQAFSQSLQSNVTIKVRSNFEVISYFVVLSNLNSAPFSTLYVGITRGSWNFSIFGFVSVFI